MMKRRLSVVMPVRNAAPFLDDAVGSILRQSHRDFEFVIGDDASTDDSRARLRTWAARDPRIRLLESDTPLGPAGSSNWVAKNASEAIVARMDADDLAHPDRLRRQLDVLHAFPDAVLVGSLFTSIDEAGRPTRGRDRSSLLITEGPLRIAHASIMYRADPFRAAGGYRARHNFYEDADLYVRMAELGPVLVLPEALLNYRFSSLGSRLSGDGRKVERALESAILWNRRHFGRGGRHPRQRKGISPDVLIDIGSQRLWSGNRPAMLRRILREANLGWNRKSLFLLAWGLWGSASPASLRAALRLRSRLRDLAAGRKIKDGQVYRWHPGAAFEPLAVPRD